jgi:putative transcriptional regulator
LQHEVVLAVHNRFTELLALKECKEGRRITFREIARETGVHESTLSNWAKQVSRFDADTIEALCKFFECGIGDLLILVPRFNREFQAVPAA